MSTCQICGREIKSANGLVAHHGYKRPDSGWQTASCSGARHLPYEVSCDQIAKAIESVKVFIARNESGLHYHVSQPPMTLSYTHSKSSWSNPVVLSVSKPADFDPNSNGYDAGRYALVFRAKRREFETAIKQATIDLDYLQDRLANWKAPVAEGA